MHSRAAPFLFMINAKLKNARNPAERTKRDLLVNKCWSYLHDNFHKFDQESKIKIALELCKKDMPQRLEHEGGEDFGLTLGEIIKDVCTAKRGANGKEEESKKVP